MTPAPQNPGASTRKRAKALSGDERRAMIIEAVTPLLIEHGKALTTRQIADAAGIAEGTIFRAFGDKDALIEAVVEKFLDPVESNKRLRAIDPTLPLEVKIGEILTQLQGRMRGIFGMMNAVGMSGPPPRRPGPEIFIGAIGDILRPDLEQLRLPPHRVASLIRLVSFASAIPQFNQGHEVPITELAGFIAYGIAGHPAERSRGNVA